MIEYSHTVWYWILGFWKSDQSPEPGLNTQKRVTHPPQGYECQGERRGSWSSRRCADCPEGSPQIVPAPGRGGQSPGGSCKQQYDSHGKSFWVCDLIHRNRMGGNFKERGGAHSDLDWTLCIGTYLVAQSIHCLWVWCDTCMWILQHECIIMTL